jgi:hypothetical protein
MAVKVIITNLPELTDWAKVNISVPMSLISDYLSPTNYSAGISFTVSDATSRRDAIHRALDQLIELTEEIKQGALEAQKELGT